MAIATSDMTINLLNQVERIRPIVEENAELLKGLIMSMDRQITLGANSDGKQQE